MPRIFRERQDRDRHTPGIALAYVNRRSRTVCDGSRRRCDCKARFGENVREIGCFIDRKVKASSNAHDLPSNENKMSDGGRGRASLGVGVWKSSQKWSVQRSAVRSIAWLDVARCIGEDFFMPELLRVCEPTFVS